MIVRCLHRQRFSRTLEARMGLDKLNKNVGNRNYEHLLHSLRLASTLPYSSVPLHFLSPPKLSSTQFAA